MKNRRKFIATVLSVCVIATTIFAASPDIAQAASKTKYYSGMPKAIGVMELSDKQITSLSKSKDIQKLADKINTVADCVRYFKKCKFKTYGDSNNSKTKKTVLYLSDNNDGNSGLVYVFPKAYTEDGSISNGVITTLYGSDWDNEKKEAPVKESLVKDVYIGRLITEEPEGGWKEDTEVQIEIIPIRDLKVKKTNGDPAGHVNIEGNNIGTADISIHVPGEYILTVEKRELSGETFLKECKGDLYGSVRAFAYLLANDYNEVGYIIMSPKKQGSAKFLLYVKTRDKYYAVDPTQYLQGENYNSKFMGNYSGKNFYSTTLKGLKSKLVKGLNNKYKVEETKVLSQIRDDQVYYGNKYIDIRANLDKKKVEAGLDKLTEAEYSYEELKKMVREDDNLDAYAEKLRTAEDIVRVLKIKQYTYTKEGTMKVNARSSSDYRVMWYGNINAQEAFNRNGGSCAGTAHIVNYILRDDFEEQGYVQIVDAGGGHIFNYYVIDGLYYFCDFVGIPGTGEIKNYADDKYYIFYVTDDPFDFKEWYINDGFFSKGFADENSSSYLYFLCMYPYQGTRLIGGTRNKHATKFDNSYWEVRSSEGKDIETILFMREGYPLEYMDPPDKSLWPKELL